MELIMSVFGDLGPSHHADERSTAARHAAKRHRRILEEAARRDLDTITRAADRQADELALAEATKLIRERKEIPPHIRVRAARAARSKGMTRSSAEELAERYHRGR
jgi:hypothetical protein